MLALAGDTQTPQDRGRSADAFERAEHEALHLTVEHRDDRERERLDLQVELRIGEREPVGREELRELVELGGLQRDGITGFNVHRQRVWPKVGSERKSSP